jgi:type IV pilus assembly protein PilY1
MNEVIKTMWKFKKIQRISWRASFLLLLIPALAHAAASMNDYCITPPFVVAGVKPNLLLMIDNSASQYDLEYVDTSTSSIFCYDNTYNNSNVCSTTTSTNCTTDANCPSGEKCINQYAGYFEADKCYTSGGVTYATDTNPLNTTFSQFKETNCANPGGIPAAVPAVGRCTSYVCIVDQTAGIPPVGDVTLTASGKFLNWLSASKMDVQKYILTGGKYDTEKQLLVSEGRGCVGSRFVKEDNALNAAGAPYYTFGVRGDVSQDIKLPSQGGTTRIDIFKSTSNFDNVACQDAITCEMVNGGNGCQSKVASCIDPNNNINNQARTTFNHALTRCWQCPSTGCCPENFDVTGDCNNITGNYGKNNNECSSLTDAQRAALKPTDPMYICLKDTAAAGPSGFAGCGMHDYASDVLAHNPAMAGQYIGVCYDPSGSSNKGNWDSTCVQYQFANFCRGLKVGEVVDPSSATKSTSQTGNIPAIMLDSGIMGQSVGSAPLRTYHARVSRNAQPTGLIQQFQNQIRIGAMKFNKYGSKSPLECGNPNSMIVYTCSDATNKDGGQIISYIGKGKCSVSGTDCISNSDCLVADEQCTQQVGNHDTENSLIKNIDDIQASTWTPFSEAFYNAIGYYAQRTDLRINSEDFIADASHNPVQYRCQRNNVLLITDGMSTADLNPSVYGLASSSSCGGSCNITGQVDTALNAAIDYAGSRNLADMAAIAQERDITNFAVTPPADKASHKITTHVVFSGAKNAALGEANPLTLMQDTATTYGGGTFQRASNAYELQTALSTAFQTIATGASSGTAASVLASGEGSGANLIQALFYPSRTFGSTEIKWTGALQNFWFYLDPMLGNSTIREESDETGPPYHLDLKGDNILHFRFDGTNTLADLYSDPGGTGVAGPFQSTKCLDETLSGSAACSSNPIKYLWEAGKKLYQRTDARNVYTTVTGLANSQFLLPDIVSSSDTTLISLLQAADANEASAIAQYTKGKDLKVCSISHKDCTSTTCGTGEGTCQAYRNRTVDFAGLTGRTWKLGDIIDSTPKVASSVPLNLYYKTYHDLSYLNFINSSDYQNRGMVFIGANDGMLHAFKLGNLTLVNDNTSVKARLDKPMGGTNDDLGKEAWAFIPMNSLPYLKYLNCTSTNSCGTDYNHLFYVDATPYIFDASIGEDPDTQKDVYHPENSWRTILIGGMRFGGASGDAGNTYGVKTPAAGNGFSSYFALDVTDPEKPRLMWEFSDADLPAADKGLGFATSGPAIVRINGKNGGKPDPNTNGHWFVVFASGPTGPIETNAHQFLGQSNQNLRIYVLDLKTGQLLNSSKTDTGITNAFSGSLINAAIDFDQNNPSSSGYYSDDVLYFGYTRAEVTDLTKAKWTEGGVLRIATKESPTPNDWFPPSTVIDSTVFDEMMGPVTAAVTKLQNYDTKKVFLYFGTGRYFYRIADQIDDDGSSGIRRKLYGVLEPCYNKESGSFKPDCTDLAAKPKNVTISSKVINPEEDIGWYIDMDLCTDSSGAELSCADPAASLKAERMVTDPLATNIGAVFFTTTKPTSDVCEWGGRTHFWAVKYDTGGAVKKGTLRGRALVQVSTGSIEEKDLSKAFTPSEGGNKIDAGDTTGATVGGRRTDMIPGVPPTGSPPGIIIPPKPVNRIVHIKER